MICPIVQASVADCPRSAGEDAANRRMRKAGRRRWSTADYDHAVTVMNRVLAQLGYGVAAEMPLAA